MLGLVPDKVKQKGAEPHNCSPGYNFNISLQDPINVVAPCDSMDVDLAGANDKTEESNGLEMKHRLLCLHKEMVLE